MQKPLVAPVSEGLVEAIVTNKWGKSAFIERFRLPNDSKDDFLIFHSTSVPAIIFPLTTDNKVITVTQFRYGAKEFVTELPGGCPEGDQSPEETLRTELLQETGYRPATVTELGGKIWFEPAAWRVQYRPFLALDCTYVKEPEPDNLEIMQTRLYSIKEWVRMLGSGVINDDKNHAVTWRALHHLGWDFLPPI